MQTITSSVGTIEQVEQVLMLLLPAGLPFLLAMAIVVSLFVFLKLYIFSCIVNAMCLGALTYMCGGLSGIGKDH